MVDALEATSKVGAALNAIELRSCRAPLKVLVKDAREAQRQLVETLETAIAMDVPVAPKIH